MAKKRITINGFGRIGRLTMNNIHSDELKETLDGALIELEEMTFAQVIVNRLLSQDANKNDPIEDNLCEIYECSTRATCYEENNCHEDLNDYFANWLKSFNDRIKQLKATIKLLRRLLCKKRGSIVYRTTLIKLVSTLRKYLDLVFNTFDSRFTKIIDLKFVMKEIENEKIRRA